MARQKQIPDIITLATDKRALGLSLSPYQRTLLKAIHGELLSREEFAIWRSATDRATYPGHPFAEVTCICGARSGKDSRIMVPLVVHSALFGNHEATGDPERQGEPIVIPIVAQDARAAKGVAFAYLKAAFERPMLRPYVDGPPQASAIKLKNGISIEVFSSTAAAVRGYSIPMGVMDEPAFYSLEGASDSDVERQAAIRRGMMAFTSPTLLLKISTPYLKSGVLYNDFTKYYGKDDPTRLVWKATSLQMNPSLNAERIAAQIEDDPERGRREYEAEWHDSSESFLASDWVDRVVERGMYGPRPERVAMGVKYIVTGDFSGGRRDEDVVAVGHGESHTGEKVFILDALQGWHGDTSSRESIIIEAAALAKTYHQDVIWGDSYAGDWIVDAFKRHGITYRQPEHKMPDGEMKRLTASLAYLQLPPLFSMAQIVLLDDPLLVRQLKMLERHAMPGGIDKVTHPLNGHDDRANAFALCATIALAGSGLPKPFSGDLATLMHLGSRSRGGGAAFGSAVNGGRVIGGQAAHLGTMYRNPGERFR